MKIAGSVIIVTGASDGIGAELARVLARRGASLVLNARNGVRLREVVPEALIVAGDITEGAVRQQIIDEAIKRFGRIDVVINNVDSAPTLLRNVVKNGNHWLDLKLVGGAKSPRDAIGAKVFLATRGVRQRADVFSGGSYGSSSDQRVHFGLGVSTKGDKVEVFWPDGMKEEVSVPNVDRIVTVVEGKGITEK